ncbi:MAG: hypothetical protein PARBB_00924 [Parabacteroides distasonis]
MDINVWQVIINKVLSYAKIFDNIFQRQVCFILNCPQKLDKKLLGAVQNETDTY